MNKKKFVNPKTGELRIGRVYQSKNSLWHGTGYTYSQLHKAMKRQGFVPVSN